MYEQIEERVKLRIGEGADNAPDGLLSELIRGVADRVLLRIGEASLPGMLESIVTEASVKAYRRQYYEGISSESDGTISTNFYDDILAEYSEELRQYAQNLGAKAKKGVVHFI